MLMIGELFIVGFYGKSIPQWVKDFATQYGIGGVVLFDYSCQIKCYENNIGSPEEVHQLCQEIHELPTSPLVFIDQEGGLVSRFKENKGFAPLPSQHQINLMQHEDKYKILMTSYKEMQWLGVNYNFAPVIDINYNPNNPSIGLRERSYSEDICNVVANTLLVDEVAKKCHIGLCLKHFPGIGGAEVDSHNQIMDLSHGLVLEQENLFYELAPKVNGNALLVSHAIINQWDKNLPITTSLSAIKRLRDRLPHTLIISDDMQMEGLQKFMSTQDAAYSALAAGTDMVCVGNNLLNEESNMLTIAQYCVTLLSNNHLLKAQVQKSIDRVRDRKQYFSKCSGDFAG